MKRWYSSFPRPVALGGVALLAGVLAAFALSVHLRDKERQMEQRLRLPMVARIVASRDLPAGLRLSPDHLATREFPADWVSSDALVTARLGEIEGRVLTTALRGGDLILPVHVTQPSSAFSTHLAPGRRAITLPVDQVNSLSGLLEPGDLIDLYVSFDHRRKLLTAPLLQGVLVLATGRETRLDAGSGSEQAYSTVTLDAAPEDVVKLVAARQAGTLTAILRHPEDVLATRRAARGDLAALLGLSNPAPPPQRRPVILYGPSTAKALPYWATGAPRPPRLPHGWFELPRDPSEAGAWALAPGNEGDPTADAGLGLMAPGDEE